MWVDGVGLWRWRYVDDRGDEPVVLEGNEAEDSEDAATPRTAPAPPFTPARSVCTSSGVFRRLG